MPTCHNHQRSTSAIHKHLQALQRNALKAAALPVCLAMPFVEISDTKMKKVVDKSPSIAYSSPSMSTTLAQSIKCKHCEKTFPSQAALQNHLKRVNAGKAGGYRKHQTPRRFTLAQVETTPRNGTATTLDKLAEIRARKEQLIAAMEQIQQDEKAAMADVEREYMEQSKKLAAYSTELTVHRKAQIAVREELEAHKQTEG